MSERRGGQFKASLVLLADLFKLPEGARIVSITGDVVQQTFERTVTVVVEHPDLPVIAEGSAPVEIMPVWEVDEGGREEVIDWGVE